MLWSHVSMTSSWGQTRKAGFVRSLPGLGLLLPPSCVSLISFMAVFHAPAAPPTPPPPFPSGKPLAFLHPTPVPCFPRDPSQPHTASHPMTVTNDRITNPRSTDMFTRMTYALTKSKWERDQGKKGCKVSCRILCNPEDG